MPAKAKNVKNDLSRLGKLSARLEHEWVYLRIVFWSISIFLVFFISQFLIVKSYEGEYFQLQSMFNAGFSLIGAILGAVIGFQNHTKKTLWIAADMVWTLAALFTVWKILAPVEIHFREAELALMRSDHLRQKVTMLRQIWQLEDRFCAAPAAHSSECAKLKTIAREVGLSSYVPVQYGIVAGSIEDLVDLQPDSEEIKSLLGFMKNYSEQYDKDAYKLVDRKETNLWLSYVYLLFLTLALGFRAGRTGAEYKRYLEEEKKTSCKNA